jgi:hypothetical protein
MAESFENMAQRAVHYFIVTMPSFNAVNSKLATEKEQENAYNFIKGIYIKLFENPELLNLKIIPDDCFESIWTEQKEKPGLTNKIRTYIKHINAFIEILYNIVCLGQADDVQIILDKNTYEVKASMLKKLSNFGITAQKNEDNYNFAFPADTVKGLKLLASVSTEYSHKSANKIHDRAYYNYLLFSLGVFNPELPYTAEIFTNIIKHKEPFDKLMNYYINNNYIRVDHKEGKINWDIVSVDYVRFYGEPTGRIDYAWKTGYLSGISIMYNESYADFMKIGLHIPFFRELLDSYNQMNDTLKEWLPIFCKCSGCRYCVQTDKTRIKPLRFVKAGKYNLCPLFTGGFTFAHLDDNTWMIERIIMLMEFIDELFKDRRVVV